MKRDLDGQTGCLVKLCAQPRHSAKKTIYVIGGSKKELVSSWTRSENALCSTECFDTFNKVTVATGRRRVVGRVRVAFD